MRTAKKQIQPRKLPTQARSRERVRKILSATYSLLEQQGLASVTTPRIAERAGVPVGSVYQYFPNKKAIFVSLYNDYLARIRDIFDTFEEAPYLNMGWKEFFEKLLRALVSAEEEGNILPELTQALRLYPEMMEVDKAHSELVDERFVAYFRRYGFTGSKAKLVRLSQFLYSLNSGTWEFRSDFDSPKYHRESANWEAAALIGVLQYYRDNQ